MILTKQITGGVVQYSDRGKMLVGADGTPYITAWSTESVTETDIDCDPADYAEVMAEIGVSDTPTAEDYEASLARLGVV